MSQKRLKELREELKNELRGTLKPSRITNLTENGCVIEGGKLPARYDRKTFSLIVWGRGNRHSGAEIHVGDLAGSELICDRFFDKFLYEIRNEEAAKRSESTDSDLYA